LNGVLVDGEDWQEDAFARAMSDLGYEVTPGLKKKGYSTANRLRELSKIGKAPSDVDAVVKLKRKYAKEIVNEKCRPIDRVIAAVDYAYNYTEGGIAVVTNCSYETAIHMLDMSGLSPFFNVIITSDDVGEKIKPHQRPYLEASYRLGVFTQDCLVFDDSEIGLDSAREARMRKIKIVNFEDLTAELIKRKLKALEIRI
jgi:HAD superfamily hydrolase (TIGR01509 family)